MRTLPLNRPLIVATLGIALLVLGTAPPAAAQDSIFDELAESGVSDEDLASRLYKAQNRLTRSDERVRVKPAGLVFCTPGTAERREARAARVSAAILRGVAAMTKAGLAPEGYTPSELIVVEVKTPGDAGRVILSKDGGALLVRRGSTAGAVSQRGTLPHLRKREDGATVQRDVLDAAGRLRVELWRRASGLAPDVARFGDVMAERLLIQRPLDGEAPKWLRQGVQLWLSAQIDGVPLPTPGHRCAGSEAFDLAPALDAEDGPPTNARAFMGRLVELGVAKGVNITDAVSVFAGADEADSATFAKAFGMPLADAAKQIAPAAAEEGVCDAGKLTCTLCEGKGKLEIACTDCAGTAKVACSSCRGRQTCPSVSCSDGWHYFPQHDRKEKCRYCGGDNEVKCRVCTGKGNEKCPVCRRGKVTRDCPGCEKGLIPCPESGVTDLLSRLCGEDDDAACPLCAVEGLMTTCDECGGTGNEGCGKCSGRAKSLCRRCNGHGIRLMVFTDGTIASATKCDRCNGKGGLKCDRCKNGAIGCKTCKKKGKIPFESADCVLCDGEKAVPNVAATVEARRQRISPPSADEADKIRDMMDNAVDFLLTCNRTGSGAFALREFRSSKTARIGSINKPTMFSNAQCLWTLATVGIDKDDERVAKAWTILREQAQELVDGKSAYRGTQQTTLALRALIGGGEDPEGDLVKGLIKAIVKGQKSNGFWAGALDSKEDGEAFEALFAAESLWLAQRRGAKVPRSCFAKTFRAANGLFGARGIKGHDDWLTGTTVASLTSLAVIAKAGELGDKSSTFDYDSLQGVQRGLAWLDRYFDIRRQPVFADGALVSASSDSGYSAYLFAIQRLAMLLSIEILAGERWYATGSRHLMTIQFDDGSFEETSRFKLNGPVRTTSSVLLFLGRVTPAVTSRE